MFSEFESKPVLNLLPYVVLYILIPAYGSISVWKQSQMGLLISLLFFVSQSIRLIGGDSWLPYSPPFSLGLPFGNFSDGQGYLIDFFAISMAIFLALLLWVLTPLNKLI